MNPSHLAQLGFHLARHAPHLVHHLVHFGLEKAGEMKQARRAQQEQSMGAHLATRYPFIEKAAEELRRREPHLTKEQAIAKATLLDQAIKKQSQVSAEAKQLANVLSVDLSQVGGSGLGGLITPADVQRSLF